MVGGACENFPRLADLGAYLSAETRHHLLPERLASPPRSRDLGGHLDRLVEIFGLVVGLLMLMTILLIGFAPVAWLFSQSTKEIAWMGALHLIFWSIATFFGLRFLENGFSHSKARSNAGLNTWTVIFILVALQMTTALRPIVGTADTFMPTEKKFFLSHWGECLKWSSSRASDSR